MTLSDDRRHESERMQPVSRAEYLEFFREALEVYEEDFPCRIVDRVAFSRVPGLKMLQPGNTLRWAAVEATMYEFHADQGCRRRANELMRAVVQGIQNTPEDLWDYFWLNTPEGMESCRKGFQKVPEKATWRGCAWFHVGGFSVALPFYLACQALDRTEGWQDPELREEALAALARIVDYHVLDEFQVAERDGPWPLSRSGRDGTGRERRYWYGWCRGDTQNIAMTMARGILGAALLMPDHPHSEQWRQWATDTVEKNFNHLSPEDAANYESDWFYSILVIIDMLGKGQEAYHLPYHRAYFEHFREMVTPGGGVVGYGDSGDQGNAAVLPILEKGATVFHDGAYKYAAYQHFKAIQALPVEQRAGYVEPLRWFDAYRWADDSIKPEPPRPHAAITQKAKVVLRDGSPPDQTYLVLSSQEGGVSAHYDANAIAHFSRGRCELLRDGQYHWKQAFYHNRLLWREGRPPGALLDYLRPKENPWHPSPDGNRNIFATEGAAEGVENDWHPAAEDFLTIRFLADLPRFKAVRTVLGPQQRTIVMESEGLCLVFDYLQVAATTTAACLYYVPEIVDRGEWWVRGLGMPKQSSQDLLIASLEPRQLSAEPQERRNMIEQVVYSSKVGAFPDGAWFVTALWPQHKGAGTIDLSEMLQQEAVGDAADGSLAQVVTVSQGKNPVTFICRAANQPGPLSYQPTRPDGLPYSWALKTDADLLRLAPAQEGLQVTIVNGTFLERDGRRLISLPYAGSWRTVIGAV